MHKFTSSVFYVGLNKLYRSYTYYPYTIINWPKLSFIIINCRAFQIASFGYVINSLLTSERNNGLIKRQLAKQALELRFKWIFIQIPPTLHRRKLFSFQYIHKLAKNPLFEVISLLIPTVQSSLPTRLCMMCEDFFLSNSSAI